MTVVTELDLPEIDYNQPDFGPQTYHQQLAEARKQGWLAHSPLAFIVLALSIVTWREVSRLTLFFVFGLGLAGYAVLVREGMQAGLSGSLPAIIAAWIPNLAFGSLAAAVVSLRRRTWRIGTQES